MQYPNHRSCFFLIKVKCVTTYHYRLSIVIPQPINHIQIIEEGNILLVWYTPQQNRIIIIFYTFFNENETQILPLKSYCIICQRKYNLLSISPNMCGRFQQHNDSLGLISYQIMYVEKCAPPPAHTDSLTVSRAALGVD